MQDKFVNLHTHTHYSLRDGIAKPVDIVKRVAELGQYGFAITDHGTTSGLMDGYKCVQKFNEQMEKDGNNYRMKFIFGAEFYFTPDVSIKDRKLYHLVLLAKDNVGYKNLLKLMTMAHQNFYYKPRIDYDILKGNTDGLICTSACIGGILGIKNDNNTWCQESIAERIQEFQRLFNNDFYIEIHTNQMKEQKLYNQMVIDMAMKYNVPLIAAVDAHYVYEKDANVHRMWINIEKEKEDGDGYYSTDDYFIMSGQQVAERLSYLPADIVSQAILNTHVIAEQCNVTVEFGGKNYPIFQAENQVEMLKEICRDGWRKKIMHRIPKEQQEQYANQVKHELNILEKADYINYFLITWDMLKWARENGIKTGVGRGSVVGSLVAYLMDITKLDPIKNDLVFERFAHLERISPPDIDNDVPNADRDKVIQYLENKYGKVFHVRTFSYMGAKGALKRAGMALKIPHAEVNALSKRIKNGLDDITDKKYAKLIELAKSFEGIISAFSVHASAMLVFPKDPNNWVAIERQDDRFVCAYEFEDLEAQGLLKLDILGLKTLDVIQQTLRLVGDEAKNIDIDNLPEYDEKTFKILCEGKTAGCFQIEGYGMTELVKKLQPKSFFDLVPLVALYRPGCLEAGMVDTFVKRHNGEESIEYLHPKMEQVLSDTYGVILYQEQIQKLANVMAGYSMGEADLLRRAVGKKKPEEMAIIIPEFISRGIKNGIPEDTMKRLAELIEFFAGYGFNKSHSAAYAYTAYQTAYLKAHYPVHFLTALLNIYSDEKQEDILPYIEEVKKWGIPLLPPDINKSDLTWKIEETEDGKIGIRVGLSYIKNVGNINIKRPVTSLQQLVDSKLPKNRIEALIKAGALDCLNVPRNKLLIELHNIDELIRQHQDKITQHQQRIRELEQEINKTNPYTKKYQQLITQLNNRKEDIEKLNGKLEELHKEKMNIENFDEVSGEQEVLGFSFFDKLARYDLSRCVEPNLSSKTPHMIGGEVVKVKPWKQKNGKPMAFVTIKTKTKTVDLVMFNKNLVPIQEGKVYVVAIQENKILDAKEARKIS